MEDIANEVPKDRWPTNGKLIVISTPFRVGSHRAENPKSFVPIIKHLQKLHEQGFLHGDIRVFNTLFGKDDTTKGWLIDFDFGRKAGEAL